MSTMQISKLKDLTGEEYSRIIGRSKADLEDALSRVNAIVMEVKEKGDIAIAKYTQRFDGAVVKDLRVSKKEFKEAKARVDVEVIGALKKAKENIEDFHKHQIIKEIFYKKDGAKLGRIVRPIESVGCYVPGGRASYPSTVLMLAVPAKVAGIEKIICITPPGENGKINDVVLVACDIAGVDEVYKVGGAQGIAALAYGTKGVPKVEKIVGPGNIYVTAAKKLVSNEVAIDLPAGPSEVLIIADDSANPEFIALDMIAQSEHDPSACSILVTISKKLAARVEEEIKRAKKNNEAKEALEKNGAILIAETLDEAVKFANKFAPEHLQIQVKNPENVLKKIKNAGSIFLGNYTPVACGDYISGTNHVLPTGGFARACSGLSVYDFVKFISVQQFDKKSLKKLGRAIITLAEAEGLRSHAESVKKRIR